jgi:glycosyltransferase involved in cell wall biosynthesis
LLDRRAELVTYVARNLEPYRGFHTFMRALPHILRRRPQAQIVIVGGDEVSYGASIDDGLTYRERMIAELGSSLDLSRVHFLGRLPYETYVKVLQVSRVHVYLSYPFVLSWSFLEAMAAGCAIVGSDTPPVVEVLKDGENGRTVDFFSPADIAERVEELLEDPAQARRLGERARADAISKYDLKTRQLPAWDRLVQSLLQGRKPPLFFDA